MSPLGNEDARAQVGTRGKGMKRKSGLLSKTVRLAFRVTCLIWFIFFACNFVHTALKWEELKREWDKAAVEAKVTHDWSDCRAIMSREFDAMDDEFELNPANVIRRWNKKY